MSKSKKTNKVVDNIAKEGQNGHKKAKQPSEQQTMNYNTFAAYVKTESVQNASFYAEALGVAKALVQLWKLRVESKK